jgi:hypothetical protein
MFKFGKQRTLSPTLKESRCEGAIKSSMTELRTERIGHFILSVSNFQVLHAFLSPRPNTDYLLAYPHSFQSDARSVSLP